MIAAQSFRIVKKHLPDLKDVYYNLAMAEAFAGDINKCFQVYDEAIQQFPMDGSVYLKYCGTIGSALNQPNDFLNIDKKPNEIMTVCHKAVDLLPEDPEALLTLGSVASLVKEYDAAVKTLEKWLSKFAGKDQEMDLSVKTNLAHTLTRDGKFERAWLLAKEVMEIQGSQVNVRTAAHVRKIGWPKDKVAYDLANKSLDLFLKDISFKDKALCPNGEWRLGMNYTEEALLQPQRLTVTALNPRTAYTTYGIAQDPVFVGPELPLYPRFYHERFINLIHHKEAYMSGHPGVVHGNCVLYTGSHYSNIDLQSFHNSDNGIQTVEVNKPVASIIQHQMRNYYHWFLESLPKLLYLKEHILDSYPEIQILVIERGAASVIDQTLDLPELASLRSRLMYYSRPSSTRYRFNKGLYLVDWIHPKDDQHDSLSQNLWAAFWPPRETLFKVRDFMHSVLKTRGLFPDPDPFYKGCIVYVTRIGTVRGFPNEMDFIIYLNKRFGDKLVVHTGKEPLLDQIAMFAKAKIVVGNHGAGLTNFVFTQPGASLIMVPMDPHVEFCFGHLVAALGERHWVVSAVPGSHFYGTYNPITNDQMAVIGNTIHEVLQTRHGIINIAEL